ncbi:MAG: response regulator [Planctomycetes bacterium]|nr:response regulator [Planctomycetota bacterium]
MITEPDQISARTRLLGQISGALIAFFGIIALFGWVFDVPILKSISPNLVTIKFNTALAFLLSGIALWLLSRPTLSPKAKPVGYLAAGMVTLIGLLTFSQYLFGWELGIDQFLWTELPGAVATSHLGRMAPATALNFLMLGAAMLLLNKPAGIRASQILALLGCLIGFFNFTGYIYGVEKLYGIAAYTPMAVHTAVAFVVLASGILFARPEHRLMAVLTSPYTGGQRARRLIPVAVIILLLLGGLILMGKKNALYSREFAFALMALGSIVFFTVAIWWNAKHLNKCDADREQAQIELQKSHDILEIKVRERTKELTKSEAQLFRAQKLESIGNLAGGVAHDFNNILAAVKGYTEMALMEMDAANPFFNNLSHINQAVDRATNLTRQLLLFSRRDTPEIKTLDLNELIKNLLKMLNRLIGENINIETKLATDIAPIRADAGNIEQVIMNLVVNARDAMIRGGKITITTENQLINEQYCQLNLEGRCGRFVCLSISDTGIGMTDEIESHLFEPFFTTKKPGEGTGLGLSVVYGIVKKHEGWVNVYSEPGRGAVIRIYLPAETSVKAGLPKPDTKIIPPDQLKGNGERILLIEDDRNIQKMARTALTKMNYTVFTVSTGAEAINLFNAENGNFHLLLSDVVLPDGNGIDLVGELKLLNPSLKVLMTSGYPSRQSYQELIKERQLPFIAKPYKLSNLFGKIKELLTKE